MQIAGLSHVPPDKEGKSGGLKSGVEVRQVILYLPCDSQGTFFTPTLANTRCDLQFNSS